MVKIRDARLGLLHYGMMFLIVLYIILYQLIALGGYLMKNEARNTVRLTLQQPTLNATSGKPCNPNDPDCLDNFRQPAELPYCKTPTRPMQGPFKTRDCTYLDGADAAAVMASSIMMTTAVHKYAQTRSTSCGTGSNTCKKLWNNTQDVASYIVDPESFTVLVDHSLTITNIYPTSEQGFLYVDKGGSVQDQICADGVAYDGVWNGGRTKKAPCYLTPDQVGGQDVFTIDLLLKAMGLSLDDKSLDPKSQNSIRYDGLVVNLQMEYSNFHSFHWGAEKGVRYVYKLSEVRPQSGYKTTKVVSTNYPSAREKEDNHGILFEVQATGELRNFDFTTLLLQLTTSLALIAVATTIVNILAQYVLAYSPFYNKAIYQLTHDFSDLRAACELPEEVLEEELVRRGHRNIPTEHTARVLALLDDGWVPPPTPSPSTENVHAEPGRPASVYMETNTRTPLAGAAAV